MHTQNNFTTFIIIWRVPGCACDYGHLSCFIQIPIHSFACIWRAFSVPLCLAQSFLFSFLACLKLILSAPLYLAQGFPISFLDHLLHLALCLTAGLLDLFFAWSNCAFCTSLPCAGLPHFVLGLFWKCTCCTCLPCCRASEFVLCLK